MSAVRKSTSGVWTHYTGQVQYIVHCILRIVKYLPNTYCVQHMWACCTHMLLPIAYPILWFVCLPTCSYNALVAYSQQVATLRSTTLIFQFSVLFLFKLIFLFLGFACVFNFVCSSILYSTKFARKKSSIFFSPASLFMARFRDITISFDLVLLLTL